MYEAETRLALANAEALAGDRVLVIGSEGRELPRALAERSGTVVVFNQNLRAHRAAAPGAGDAYEHRFGAWLEPDDAAFDAIVVMLPKEVERLRLVLAMARAAAAPGARITVVGHNRAGIRSAGARLQEIAVEPAVLDTRYHCRALTATIAAPAPATLGDWRAEYEAAGVHAVTYPGVFAHGRLDDGTRLLLEAAHVNSGARALDVGCGSGIIAAWAATAGATVDAVDVDALAVAASTETLAPFEQARAFASDVYSDAGEQYNVILSNPPFHSGTRTTHAVAQRIIEDARARLVRRGELWLVANRFLDYLTLLQEAFPRVEVAAEDGRYRVIHARGA